eukprot:3932926-Rhodomonas_salina.1
MRRAVGVPPRCVSSIAHVGPGTGCVTLPRSTRVPNPDLHFRDRGSGVRSRTLCSTNSVLCSGRPSDVLSSSGGVS